MVIQAQILDVATFEFKEVARLANGGDPIAAYRCWMRGVEILHSPFIVPTTSELEKFPPTLEALCLQHPCHRCAPHFGSFKFLWVEQRYHRSARGTAWQWSGSSSMDLVCWWHCWEPSGSTGCGTPTRGMDSICEGQGDVVWKDGRILEAEFSSAGGLWHSFSNCRPQLLREHCMTFYASSSFRVET